MSKLGISKVLSTIGLVAMLSSDMLGASKLAGIELGSDNYEIGCQKIKDIITKKDLSKLKEFKQTNTSCGYNYTIFIGLKSSNGKTIDYIGLKNEYFGFNFIEDPKTVAQAYIGRMDAVAHELTYNAEKKTYNGHSDISKEGVVIDWMTISIFKEQNESSKFDIK